MVFKSEPLDIRTPFAAASLAQKQVGMAEELANGSSKTAPFAAALRNNRRR